jgi:hypothetical protein
MQAEAQRGPRGIAASRYRVCVVWNLNREASVLDSQWREDVFREVLASVPHGCDECAFRFKVRA